MLRLPMAQKTTARSTKTPTMPRVTVSKYARETAHQ